MTMQGSMLLGGLALVIAGIWWLVKAAIAHYVIMKLARRARAVSEWMRANGQCLAKQHGDMMVCQECLSAWDVNDPEPPSCRVP